MLPYPTSVTRLRRASDLSCYEDNCLLPPDLYCFKCGERACLNHAQRYRSSYGGNIFAQCLSCLDFYGPPLRLLQVGMQTRVKPTHIFDKIPGSSITSCAKCHFSYMDVELGPSLFFWRTEHPSRITALCSMCILQNPLRAKAKLPDPFILNHFTGHYSLEEFLRIQIRASNAQTLSKQYQTFDHVYVYRYRSRSPLRRRVLTPAEPPTPINRSRSPVRRRQ